MRNRNFQLRLTEAERISIERLANILDRKPSDAVRFVIRKVLRELEDHPPQTQTASG